MSIPRTDRPDGPDPAEGADRPEGPDEPDQAKGAAPGVPTGRPRTETVLALTAAASALCADALDDTADLWVVLDLAALLAAGAALALLLRTVSVVRGRPALTEVATATVTASISAAAWLLARHGPQAGVGGLLLATAAVMGAVLTVLILGGALVQHRRGAAPAQGAPVRALVGSLPGRAAALTTVSAATVAVAAALRDALVR